MRREREPLAHLQAIIAAESACRPCPSLELDGQRDALVLTISVDAFRGPARVSLGRMERRAIPWLAGALTVLAAGCGGGGKTKTVTVESDQKAKPEASATATASAAPDAPIVEAQASVDSKRVRFMVTELRRSGPTVIINAQLELADPASSQAAQVNDTFNDGLSEPLTHGDSEGADVFDGVALIDPVGKKKYLVARDADGRCVCSNQLSSSFAKADAPVELQATLTAPPADVRQVDLYVPRVKTFRAVPLAQ
jgi:hypothetical protein